MVTGLDSTHDPRLRSWVADANRHTDFPIQNLPLGVFRAAGSDPRGGVAIGDSVLDLRLLRDAGLLRREAQAACAAGAESSLNSLLTMGAEARAGLRQGISVLLAEHAPARPELLHAASDCQMLLPVRISEYTDFYAGIHHAENVGKLFRPDSPLLPNYKWVPIGYHGRASSVRVSGSPVLRPNGQRKLPEETEPGFGPARSLDFELELGLWVGPGNELGEPVPVGRAAEHIAGYCLLNDWSARDIQTWEYQPLGPFLAKSFHTTVSPWIITPEALAPFRRAQNTRPAGDPEPLPYLLDDMDQSSGALALELQVLLRTRSMRAASLAAEQISLSRTKHLYWTPAQLLAHHTSNGCNLQAGNLLGTGTISSPTPDGLGSLLEMTLGGAKALELANGQQRRFLEDGDEVILRATARREGFVSIGFGECRGMVLPAKANA